MQYVWKIEVYKIQWTWMMILWICFNLRMLFFNILTWRKFIDFLCCWNNHNARITNFEKKHYKQDRVNLENDWMMMNCMNCSNADLKMIASDVDSLQENRDARLKHSRDDEENVANIIDLLIKISTLEKEKSKDHSWKEIALKLIQRLQLDSEEKHHMNQNVFITKNVQKLKTSVQLLNKQLHTQKNICLSTKITSWANMTREEIATRK